jgi:hypothetical protein
LQRDCENENWDQEPPMTFNSATGLLSQLLGLRLAYKTVYSWSRFGIKGIRLEHVRIGRSLFATRGAVVRFVRAILEVDPKGYDCFSIPGVGSRATVASALAAFVAGEHGIGTESPDCGAQHEDWPERANHARPLLGTTPRQP